MTIPIVSSDPTEGSVDPGALVFTPSNALTPQYVTVTGVNAPMVDGDVSYAIRIGQAESADADYAGIDPPDLPAVNRDDDVAPPPALSVADTVVGEGDSGTTSARFVVTLSPASDKIVTVQYATTEGDAGGGSCAGDADYIATAGSLNFPPGATSLPVEVTVCGDSAVEPDETFSLTLTSPTNAVLNRARATGTITNDDRRPPACAPRPSPRIGVREIGSGRLEVTVLAATNAGASNSLRRLDFGAARNARVEVPGAAPGTPGGPAATPGMPNGTAGNFSVPLGDGTQQATFVVQRQGAGDFKADYTVVDHCHAVAPFTTFIGGGVGVR